MKSFIGVDLAWGEGDDRRPANETGLVEIDEAGDVLEAGWVRGIDAVVDWLTSRATLWSLIAIDAPLVVPNALGMRACEREVGQRYGRWKVSANSTNLGRGWQAGVALRDRLEEAGFRYWSGVEDRPDESVAFFECYPYTAIVGAAEFGYDVERPRYKRMVSTLTPAERREFRAQECDELIRRFAGFHEVDPSIDLRSHEVTRALVDEPSPLLDLQYKHREDLLDAAIAAWTAALWDRFGTERCQVLGADSESDSAGRLATIIAPMRPEQARSARSTTRERSKETISDASGYRSADSSRARSLLFGGVDKVEVIKPAGRSYSFPVEGTIRVELLDGGKTLRLITD